MYSGALFRCELDVGPRPSRTLAGGRPVLIGSVGPTLALFQPILLGRAVCSIFPRSLTCRAVLLRSTIRSILAGRLPGRPAFFIPLRRWLSGPAVLLLRVALARPVLSLLPGSLPGRLAAAAIWLRLAGAAIRSLVAGTRRILRRHFFCRSAALLLLLLRHPLLLSQRSARCCD